MNQSFTIRLSANHLQVIERALLEMPYRFAAPVIQAIAGQVQQQTSSEDTSVAE